MTNREAIDLYESVRYNLTHHRHKEAVDVAFAALTQNHFREVTKKTNADHIRSMTDEELAEFLCGVHDDEDGKFICGTTIIDYDQYKIADWLKQPYGGDA